MTWYNVNEELYKSSHLTHRPVHLLAKFLDCDNSSLIETFVHIREPSRLAPEDVDVERAYSVCVWVNGNRPRTPVEGIYASDAEVSLGTILQLQNMLKSSIITRIMF